MLTRVLHHFTFDPASRAVRLALHEARIEFSENPVRPWEPDCGLDALNPSAMPPVLVEARPMGQSAVCELLAILGYVEDHLKGASLIGEGVDERAETRRLIQHFDRRFNDEVNALLLHERMEKPLLRMGPPEARALRAGREALKSHLKQLEALAGEREWLAGRTLTQADLVAGAHLSVLDYFGEVNWDSVPALKTWYMKLKSRPCFRTLLTDRFPGVAAAGHYGELDF